MKIAEFMKENEKLDEDYEKSADGQKFSEIMAEAASVWSNAAAKGYVIKAAQMLDIKRDNIAALLKAMHWAFDDLTVEEAEEIHREFLFGRQEK